MLSVCVVLPDDIPPNSGALSQIEVIAPEGSVVNPLAPAPVMFSTTAIGYEVADAVMKAFEGIAPERVGEPGLGFCLCTTFGKDARFDDDLYFTLDFGSSLVSAGGAYGTDGWGAWPASVSSLVLANVEMQELQYPLTFDIYEYADNACGAGRWRGVPGFFMQRSVGGKHPAYVNLTEEGDRHPMPGYVGGHAGASSYAILRPGTERAERITESVAEAELMPGESLLTFKGGGGGWGSPLEREPELVLDDVFDGYVSVEIARDVYGVALAEDEYGKLGIDVPGTEALRSA
jgi:N-methylhydantoinase B